MHSELNRNKISILPQINGGNSAFGMRQRRIGSYCRMCFFLFLCFTLRCVALICLVGASILMSCTGDESVRELSEERDAIIRIDINTDTPKDATTRSVDEDRISDLHVLVYNSLGELTGKTYSTFTGAAYSISVLARSGTGCKIYAIANTGSSTLFDGTIAGTEDKLKIMTTNLATWSTLNNASGTVYLPMCGSTLADIAVGTSSLQDGITVTRLVARITLDVGIASSSGVTISGYRVYGVPGRSYYVPRPLGTEGDETDTESIRAEDACLPTNSENWTNSGEISLSDVTSFNSTFYMYENRAGVNVAITAQKDKVKSNVSGTPADSAAYVIIYGKATGYSSLSWKIYLGANNTTNFNIKRNKQYTYTITLKPNDTDTRITYEKSGTVWAGSNIYWDGTKLTFDTETTDANNKQGVCFRWGSLVGVSLNSTYVTYTPTYNSTTPTSSTWAMATGTSSNFTSITYFTDNVTSVGQTNTYLNDDTQNTDVNYAAYKGDICKYLSKTGAVSGRWRMPTAKEFNAADLADEGSVSWTTATIPWTKFGDFASTYGNVEGTTSISSGGTYTANGSSSKFLASGFRTTDGTLSYVGLYGYYWSSSAYTGSTGGYSLGFFSSYVTPASNNFRQVGFAVRCVQN